MNNCKPTIIITKLPTAISFFVSIFIIPLNTFPVNQFWSRECRKLHLRESNFQGSMPPDLPRGFWLWHSTFAPVVRSASLPADPLHPVLPNATETLIYTTSDGRVESIIRSDDCEIVNSVGHGNFTFVRKKSGKSEGILETSGCDNHKELMRGQLWASLHNVMCHIKAVITRLHHEIRLNLVTIGNHPHVDQTSLCFLKFLIHFCFSGKRWIEY